MKAYGVSLLTAEFWVWLRLEACIELALLLLVYRRLGGGWPALAALFLLPDLAILGYLSGPRTGALVYNFAHSYAVAGTAILGLLFFDGGVPATFLVWPIHIAFDRSIGYGLKSASGFFLTHLSEPKLPA